MCCENGNGFGIRLKSFMFWENIRNTKHWLKTLVALCIILWLRKKRQQQQQQKICWGNNKLFLMGCFREHDQTILIIFCLLYTENHLTEIIFCFLCSKKYWKIRINHVKLNYSKTWRIPSGLRREDYEIFKQISWRWQKNSTLGHRSYLWSWPQQHKPLTLPPPSCQHHQT